MSEFNDLLEIIMTGVKELAEGTLKDHVDEAVLDGKAFLQEIEVDLKRWTMLLESGDLTPGDFGWLVSGRKALAKMEALKQAGLAVVKVEAFKSGLTPVLPIVPLMWYHKGGYSHWGACVIILLCSSSMPVISITEAQQEAVEAITAAFADRVKRAGAAGGDRLGQDLCGGQHHREIETLAAQLYQEFKEFSPENRVGYFINYYDYYRPEAYVPQKNLYIARKVSINPELGKLGDSQKNLFPGNCVEFLGGWLTDRGSWIIFNKEQVQENINIYKY